MRILSVTQSYYPFLETGGPAVKVRAIARGLAQRGHQVTVLTSDLGIARYARESNSWLADRWGWRSGADGIETIYLRRLAQYRSVTWNPGIVSFCRERLAEFEIVHIYGLYDLLGPAVARACRKRGIPYVVEPMGMFRPIVRSIPLKWLYRGMLGNAMVGGAGMLVATAPQEKRELIEDGLPEGKIVIRRNGIEPPGALPEWGMFRSRWRIPKEAQVVLFLGRLVSKKSPDLLLDAFARWRSRSDSAATAVLVLAGPEEADGYGAKLRARVGALGLSSAVLFAGPLYDADKWAAFRDADLFVLPSQNENFGNTAAEAVSCGTPVLVTDSCGIAPMLEGRAGIVVPHECDAVSRAMEAILSDGLLRERLKAGCAAVAGDLDWVQPLSETEQLYARLIKTRRAE